MFRLDFFVTFACLHATFALSAQQVYDHNAALNQEGVMLHWGNLGSDRVAFKVSMPLTNGQFGWFGFGLSPTGGMRGADIAVGFFDESDQFRLEVRRICGRLCRVTDDRVL